MQLLPPGKVAVVTGIGPGLGREIALGLAGLGAKLALGAPRRRSRARQAGLRGSTTHPRESAAHAPPAVAQRVQAQTATRLPPSPKHCRRSVRAAHLQPPSHARFAANPIAQGGRVWAPGAASPLRAAPAKSPGAVEKESQARYAAAKAARASGPLTLSRPERRKNWSAWKRRKLFVFFFTDTRRTAGVGPFTISPDGRGGQEKGEGYSARAC